MICPLCIDTMLAPHHRGGMEIDVCPTCRGVWLDRGELEGLIEAPGPAEAAPSGLSRETRAGGRATPERADVSTNGKKKRKKSWGERLGDALEDVLDSDTTNWAYPRDSRCRAQECP